MSSIAGACRFRSRHWVQLRRSVDSRAGHSKRQAAGLSPGGFTRIFGCQGPEDARSLSAGRTRTLNKLANLPCDDRHDSRPLSGGGGWSCPGMRLSAPDDSPKNTLGLPEIELGLLPAWGGTQRLPRTVGLERALQVIPRGRPLKARDALRWGLGCAGQDRTRASEALNRMIDGHCAAESVLK